VNLRRAIAGVGSLYREAADAERQYVGTCFSILDASVFVTAGHCVRNSDVQTLRINHFGGDDPDCFTHVRAVHMIADADIAVVTTDAPNAKWASPFQSLKYAADFGEEVYAIGHPDLFSASPNKHELRFFRGIIQRPFLHESPRQKPYSAFELSFACPLGLSGGPVIRAEAGHEVLGVVTGNCETYSVIDTEQTNGTSSVVETRRIISYGVAANIVYAAPKLQDLLGRSLPNRLSEQ